MNHAEEIICLRSKIESLQIEREALTSQVRGRADVEAQIRALVDRLHASGTGALANELLRTAAGKFPAPFTVSGLVPIGHAPSVAPFTVDIGGLIVSMMGKEAVCAALLQSLSGVPESSNSQQRAARLKAIGSELDALEAEEEAAICDAEMFGESIARRADARPEITLALP